MIDKFAIDAELGEALQPNEIEIAQKIVEFITAGVRQQFQKEGRPARRDAHPRAHGCVGAEFRVEDELPANFAQGVFVPGKRYPAWIRFSNGDANVQRPDGEGDVRAMAIKLLDVPGDKILEEQKSAPTQDFILVNSPVFFTDDPSDYLKLVERNASPNPIVKASELLAIGFKGAEIAIKMAASRIGNPFGIRYWSAVPYRLGDAPFKQAVKFSVIPYSPPEWQPSDHSNPYFLRQVMIDQLQAHDVLFDFVVQLRASDAMSVEDCRTEWHEAQAPFHKVATITIPKQVFATPERDALAENLAFNPWHALPQHRPLGSTNRIRRVVYEAVSTLRRELNGVTTKEPMAWVDTSAAPQGKP
jgi:hypothetical protein